MNHWLITPNFRPSPQAKQMIVVGLVVTLILIWVMFRPVIMPNPLEIIAALPALWQNGLSDALLSSFWTATQAIIISSLISLPLAYLSRVPLAAPVSIAVGYMRFLSPAVFFLLLLFILKTPHAVKIGMLVLGETFFMTTTMVGVVGSIPDEAFDEARVIRMSPWASTYYVVVRGTLSDAITAIKDNSAIGWSMLMMVEGFLRSEGGVGVLLANQERYLHFDGVYAIAIVVLMVGLGQDYFWRWLRGELCPHTLLG